MTFCLGNDLCFNFSEENNYHEIVTVGDGHAAFFDILAPPYNHEDYDDLDEVADEIRECHFFRELVFSNNNQIQSDSDQEHEEEQNGGGGGNGSPTRVGRKQIWLQRIQAPRDYFCDAEPFIGPALNL